MDGVHSIGVPTNKSRFRAMLPEKADCDLVNIEGLRVLALKKAVFINLR